MTTLQNCEAAPPATPSDTPPLLARTVRRQRAADSLAEVAALLAQSLDPLVVGQRIVDTVCGLFDVQNALLFRLLASGDLLSLAMAGDVGLAADPQVTFPQGGGAVGLAVQQRMPVATVDLFQDPRLQFPPALRQRVEQAPHRAVLAVPLLVQDRVIGALSLGDHVGRVFDQDEVRLLQTFAVHAALALDNATLYAAAQQQQREAGVMASLARDLNASLDLQTVLQRVVEHAQELCGSDMARIALRDNRIGVRLRLMGVQQCAGRCQSLGFSAVAQLSPAVHAVPRRPRYRP